MSEVRVLDHGFVRLDAAMASDLSVVNSARVSFAKRHESIEDGDRQLINFLMSERHGTPFEHNAFRFHVRAPIFVVREWQRHRIGSFNEQSGRYMELEELYYVPQSVRKQEGRPGQYRFEMIDDKGTVLRALSKISESAHSSFRAYRALLDAGVAKEQARIVLPLNLYTQFYWTVNARSLMNFLNLRSAPTAMYEIREYCTPLEGFFHAEMPLTYRSWLSNERVAP